MTERLAHTGWDEVVRVPELGACHEWRGARTRGYGIVGRGDGTNTGAHRASFEVHNGPITDGVLIRHRCDNPPCINPTHLIAGTHAENTSDMLTRGRDMHGERCTTSKLTDADAFEIRALYALGNFTQIVLAERFGVTRPTISRLVNGKSFRLTA